MSRTTLSCLSDCELLGRLKSLVEKERTTTLEILLHLNEVERRRLHLSLGYPSLFEYCTRHLGYSSSAAGRRIHAARCIRDFPEVLGLLEKNQVHLSSVCLVAPILTEANKGDLLSRIRNKSQKEIEGIVADHRPPVAFRDRARPVCVAVPEVPKKASVIPPVVVSTHSRSGSGISPSVAAASVAGDPPEVADETGVLLRCKPHPSVSPPKPPSVRLERKLLVQFLASEAFMKKFEKARAFLSNRVGESTFERVFEALVDEFLDRHSPESKKERREKRRESRRAAGRQATTPVKPSTPPAQRPLVTDKAKPTIRQPEVTDGAKPATPRTRVTDGPDRSRCISPVVRDTVFTRDKNRCTYVGKTGERCHTTHGLQIDHIVPFARGGRNTADNLRLLCGRHNRLEAERVYGANAIRRYRPRE